MTTPPAAGRTPLWEELARRDNDYDAVVDGIVAQLGVGWHDPTPPALASGRRVSVVIAARNAGFSLPAVLDALAAQRTDGHVQVVVVDDASTDDTAAIAAAHPVTDTVMRLRGRVGSGCARNVGTLLARGRTIVYLDADMVLPDHVIADLGARAHPDLVLVGFRHNVPFQPDPAGRARVPAGEPDLAADHRVVWRPPTGVPLFYTGLVLHEPFDGRPLDATDEFRALGGGRRYYDWDLPRMVVTALVAVPRARVIAVGGFEPAFAAGWGCDDTFLGARLIAAGCKVVPVRQARGFHLDPPDADAAWQDKYATAGRNVALYQRLLTHPRTAVALTNQPDVLHQLAEGVRLS